MFFSFFAPQSSSKAVIQLTESKTKRVHSFLDYISSGTKLHCTFAIDFTGIKFPIRQVIGLVLIATIIVGKQIRTAILIFRPVYITWGAILRNTSWQWGPSETSFRWSNTLFYRASSSKLTFFDWIVYRITRVKCFPCSISERARLQFHTNCTSAVLTASWTLTDLACIRFSWARRDALVRRLSTSPAQPRNDWNGVGSIAKTIFCWSFWRAGKLQTSARQLRYKPAFV